MFFDDLIDNIQESAESAFSNFGESVINSGWEQLGFVETGDKPNQNKTAKEVMSGQRGGPRTPVITPRPSAETNQLKNGFGFSFGQNGSGAMTPMIIVGAFAVLALLLRRK